MLFVESHLLDVGRAALKQLAQSNVTTTPPPLPPPVLVAISDDDDGETTGGMMSQCRRTCGPCPCSTAKRLEHVVGGANICLRRLTAKTVFDAIGDCRSRCAS